MKKIFTTLAAVLASVNMFAQGWPANYSGVMLQGFYWDSYLDSKWTNLEAQAPELSSISTSYGFRRAPTAAADAQWDTTTCTGLAITTARLATKPSCAL